MDDDGNTPTTRLLTLLNVSALKLKKRKHPDFDPLPAPAPKLNKKRKAQSIAFATDPNPREENKDADVDVDAEEDGQDAEDEDAVDEDEPAAALDSYESHFGPNPRILTQAARTAVDQRQCKSCRAQVGTLSVVASLPPAETSLPSAEAGADAKPGAGPLDAKLRGKTAVLERLRTPFEARQAKQPPEETKFQNALLSILCGHLDLYHTALPTELHRSAREAIALHALDHITKKRRRILKNNDRRSHATAPDDDTTATTDQGFTRPSVLLLLPFRSSALAWLAALTTHTPPPHYQIENHARFVAEYGLPPGAVDKLTDAPTGTYPNDHVATFAGNVDDNFRVGVKMTRKSVKLFAEFYGCDLILASPLGLRMSIEKEGNADFLSSVEVLVVDQMDALSMQNWDHVQFVLSHMNKLPKDSHDADFSRIKPWYLDGHSAYLRQSILLSAFETPETRSLYNQSLMNVAGKARVEKSWPAIQVPASIDQLFVSFDCASPKDEPEKRFNYFTTQLFPKILKSAVQSSNTAIFVPSSLDFIRVHNYFRKHAGVSFAVLSEYSTNQDISRARQAFFTAKASFLLISERFHFYRRYKIRGIRNVLFYGPPDHPQFFSEFLSYPFLDDGVDGVDVCVRVLWCRYDRFRLERIVGTKGIGAFLDGV
ncbi:digestive organ expansion factor [Leucogyrophana mollusca]|uniref:Digestive organ expansion factor n=1 Tax=Leucogyrophana mollusca TaxID=85980 RepID=A0ACB8AY18_9AGAM|nr:digestive organ expansion factor [Leucogyrophana mollusca]